MSVHTCSYYCRRPACIAAQREELRDKYWELEKKLKHYQERELNLEADIQYMSEVIQMLREIIWWCKHHVEQARIWDGMVWHWNLLHPDYAKNIWTRLNNEKDLKVELITRK